MDRKKRKYQRGFTLIEIMIVLAIMTLIFGLVGVNVMSSFKDAKKKTAKIQIAKYQEGLDAFYIANGFYPNSSQGLQALVTKPTVGRTADSYPDGGFMKKVDKDPWGFDYVYVCEDYSKYTLTSSGPDGQAGTEDDVKSE